MNTMSKKASPNLPRWILDVCGFVVAGGGIMLARFSQNDYIAIIGGIMVAVGMGLLGVARLTK